MRTRKWKLALLVSGVAGCALLVGCWSSAPSAHTHSRNYSYGEAPVDPPGCSGTQFDDVTGGGKLFKLYCGQCHNARALAERPFANYEVAVAHMRDSAYLTGKEYRQIIHFLRRWHDVGPPTPDVEPSPKKLIFDRPIPELRSDADGKDKAGALPNKDELVTPPLRPVPTP
jgi:hypothetical protein